MICFGVLLVCFLLGGGWGVGSVGWGIKFTKDGVFTSCTNEMRSLWYNLYNSSLDRENLFLWVIVKHACFNNLVFTFILSETVQWGPNRPARADGYSPDLHFILNTIYSKHAQQDLQSPSATFTTETFRELKL